MYVTRRDLDKLEKQLDKALLMYAKTNQRGYLYEIIRNIIVRIFCGLRDLCIRKQA
jgi:hypothetical protein